MAVQLPDTEFTIRAPRDDVAQHSKAYWRQMSVEGDFDRLGDRFKVDIDPEPLERDGYKLRGSAAIRTRLRTTVNLEIAITLVEIDGGKHTQAQAETSVTGLGAGTVVRSMSYLLNPIVEHIQNQFAGGLEKYIADQAQLQSRPSQSVEF